MDRVPVAEVLTRLGYQIEDLRRAAGSRGGKVRFPCVYHDGAENPNLEMWIDKDPEGRFNPGDHQCFVCKAKGDFAKFYARKLGTAREMALGELDRLYSGAEELQAEVDRVLVGQWHQALLNDEDLCRRLLDAKGITRDTIVRREIGWEAKAERYTIPIMDGQRRVINVRRYQPGNTDGMKMINQKGFGSQLALYPFDNLLREGAEFDRSNFKSEARKLLCHEDPLQEPVIIAEGEAKALLLEQHGFRGISGTGGAGTWNKSLTHHLRGRRVYIAYDIDEAGVRESVRLAKDLKKAVSWVGIVKLPLELTKHQKDVTDYFLTAGYGAQDFANLMLETQEFKPQGRKNIDESPGESLLQVTLRNSVKAQYSGKQIETEFIVASKDTSPFIIPRKITVDCQRDQGPMCEGCSVFLRGKTDTLAENEFELAEADAATLRLLNIRHEMQERVLREIHGITGSCRRSVIEPVETMNVEHLRLAPAIDVSNAESAEEDCTRVGYRFGFGAEANTVYRAQGYVLPDPQSQIAVLMLPKIVPIADSLSEFRDAVSDEDLAALKVFQAADPNNVDSIQDRLAQLYEDLTINVTGIYDRDDMHLLMDLCWHSVLYLPGKPLGRVEPERGWCDIMIIGDTRQGKTETANRLRAHYGLGAWAPVKICTRAGLIGNAQQVGSRWHISWGIIPNNDRRIVVIEEAKGMDKEILQQLTDVRSSGRAMLIMVETATAHARTRLLWLSNPRSDRSMDTYPFGVEALKELVGAQEDIGRFTAAMAVCSGEVDVETLSGSRAQTVKPKHWATSALCRRLVLWAWTRTSEEIEFAPGATAEIKKVVVEHSERFSPTIPLVEPADHRFKIARLAAALAARTFSTDASCRKLIITPAHIRYVGDFLTTLYSAPGLAYDQWSSIEKAAREIRDEGRVREALINTGNNVADGCMALLGLTEINNSDLEDVFGCGKEGARELMSVLVQTQCLRRRGQARFRSPAFNKFLKKFADELRASGMTSKKNGTSDGASGVSDPVDAGDQDF